jgi:hypothetical protein
MFTKFINFFYRNQIDDKKNILLKNYLKSYIRFKNNLQNINHITSPFLYPIYINENIYHLLICINQYDDIDEHKKIILKYIIEKRISYDDFETLFLKVFQNNEDDYKIMKEFIKPFYKENKKESNILKLIINVFLFYIYYIQFYLILHEFLEIKHDDLEYYFYLFIHYNEKEEKNIQKKEISYYYFHLYIYKLFTIFYQTIHFLQDVTSIQYDFDIHNTLSLKQIFYKKILINKKQKDKRRR